MRAKVAFTLLATLQSVTQLGAQQTPIEAYAACVQIVTSDAPIPEGAAETCERARQVGLPSADYALALVLLHAGPPERHGEAISLLEGAVASGHPGAALTLGASYLRSEDAAVRQRGLDHLDFAYCSGHPQAREIVQGWKDGSVPSCPESAALEMTGTWTASLAWATAQPGEGSQPPRLQVRLGGATAQVRIESDGKWIPVKDGSFTVTQLDGTAIVQSLDSGWDLDGEWVESWVVHLHRLDSARARMTLLRSVRNVHLPIDSEWKVFSNLAVGEATRTDS